MNTHDSSVAHQIAEAVRRFQKQNPGQVRQAVTVVLSEDMVATTLHDALTITEMALAKSVEGAAQVRGHLRQLFATTSEALCLEIQRITGREVLESAADFEPRTGAIVHAFTTCGVVQVFPLAPDATENRHSNVPPLGQQLHRCKSKSMDSTELTSTEYPPHRLSASASRLPALALPVTRDPGLRR